MPCYLCHQCNQNVTISPSSTQICCPLCHGGFLEELPLDLYSCLPHRMFARQAQPPLVEPPFSSLPEDSGNEEHYSISSLPSIQITGDHVNSESNSSSCAVCLTEFQVRSMVKQMPCKHLYHPECILPWLKLHNTCPTCRYELPPTEEQQHEHGGRGRAGEGQYFRRRQMQRALTRVVEGQYSRRRQRQRALAHPRR